MRSLKLVVCLVFFVLLSTSPSILSPPSGDYIWVDKGSYCIGDQIRISFYMPGTGSVEIRDHTPDGRTAIVYSAEQEGKESSYRTMNARIDGPPGTETLEIEIWEGCWPKPCFGLGWWTDSVSFDVRDCDPCRNVNCEPRCYGCDYHDTYCEDGECLKGGLIESDSSRCGSGCGDPCRNVNCEPRCYGCDYHDTYCEDGECVKGGLIESDSSRCGSGCGEKEELDEKERDRLYHAYADALDGNSWNETASEVMRYFSDWYNSKFGEPYAAVKSTTSGIVYSKYDAAEAATHELCTLVAYIKCTDTGFCLNMAYTESHVTGVPERLREVSSLIKAGEQNKALSRIDSLYKDIWEAHQHISQAIVAQNEEFVAQLFESAMKFLEAECVHLGGKCNYPEPKPHEPKSPICSGSALIFILIVTGVLLHWKRN